MIEYDMELVDEDCAFISELSRLVSGREHQDLDLVGISFRADPDGDPNWAGAWQRTFPRETSYYATFPLVLVSRRLAAFAFAQRQLEALRRSPVVHCEAFLPSCGQAAGFNCVDFQDIFPGCYDDMVMMNARGRRLGMPLGAPYAAKPSVRVIHPVYSHEEFLNRLYTKYLGGGRSDLDGLLVALEQPEIDVLPPSLLASFFRRLPAAAAEAILQSRSQRLRVVLDTQQQVSA